MKLDVSLTRYMSKEELRALRGVESGMRNHEWVSAGNVGALSGLRIHGLQAIMGSLLRQKLVVHEKKAYDAYKLTYLGYDILALHDMNKKGLIKDVGRRIGVGKEADVHVCRNPEGEVLCLKIHRLGRISFRSVRNNRDYTKCYRHGKVKLYDNHKHVHAGEGTDEETTSNLEEDSQQKCIAGKTLNTILNSCIPHSLSSRRDSCSWMRLSKLAAYKEFSAMLHLHSMGFPIPVPYHVNRHIVLMSFVDSYPISQVKHLIHPYYILEKLMRLIVRLAEIGFIHGDFNEFNIMINDDEKITVIDFPQMISVNHPNAEAYFERDVKCIKNLFAKKYGIEVIEAPSFKDAISLNSIKDSSLSIENDKLCAKWNFTSKDEDLLENEFKNLNLGNEDSDENINEIRQHDSKESNNVINLEPEYKLIMKTNNNNNEMNNGCNSYNDDNIEESDDVNSISDTVSLDSGKNGNNHSMQIIQPTRRRYTNYYARRKMKKRYNPGNCGVKKNRDKRVIQEQIKYAW